MRLHQGVAAKLVRLKGLLPQTDVPALVARHTGLLSTDPAAMAASTGCTQVHGRLRKLPKSGKMHLSLRLKARACLRSMQMECCTQTLRAWSADTSLGAHCKQ